MFHIDGIGVNAAQVQFYVYTPSDTRSNEIVPSELVIFLPFGTVQLQGEAADIVFDHLKSISASLEASEGVAANVAISIFAPQQGAPTPQAG